MEIQFKEKTYEKYFGHELSRLTTITYSPDQCDESILGFDEAFFMPKEWFQRHGPYVRRSRRGRLSGIEIKDFNFLGKLAAERMPPFKFNLFVQFKRPKFLSSRGAKQWSDWKQSYYRYETTPHQQEALEKIDAQSYGRAATIYASPAFWGDSDLWENVRNEDVVNHSNMAEVGKLRGHDHYSYTTPGFHGKGHSETVDIESQPLSQIIGSALERNEPIPLNQHLKKTASTIIDALRDSDSALPILHQAQTALNIEEFDPNSLYGAIEIIQVFSDAFDVQCIAVG